MLLSTGNQCARVGLRMRQIISFFASVAAEKKRERNARSECERVGKEKNATTDERTKLEETSRAGADAQLPLGRKNNKSGRSSNDESETDSPSDHF